MQEDEVLMLKGDEIASLLEGKEPKILNAILRAYEIHASGDCSLPHSGFLRFPGGERNRIISLPAFLGSEVDEAGIKWISSFPGNLELNMDRASAVIVLNSTRTGRIKVVFEGSVISAKRTAASAALAAGLLLEENEVETVSMIGCGLINFEVARFLVSTFPRLRRLVAYDINEARSAHFRDKAAALGDGLETEPAGSLEEAIKASRLVSFATTATTPYVLDPGLFGGENVILHVSLRDLSPAVILSGRNVVDDVDHVCRAETSVHLVEKQVGNRDFIDATLIELAAGKKLRDGSGPVIFSPFGLGVLDIALASLVRDLASETRLGIRIPGFFPQRF